MERSVYPLRVSMHRRKGLIRMKTSRFFKKTYCARILIESTRFPPFGFDIKEISSSSTADISFLQKDLSCPDSDRWHSAPPFMFAIAEISLEASKCLGGNREAKTSMHKAITTM